MRTKSLWVIVSPQNGADYLFWSRGAVVGIKVWAIFGWVGRPAASRLSIVGLGTVWAECPLHPALHCITLHIECCAHCAHCIKCLSFTVLKEYSAYCACSANIAQCSQFIMLIVHNVKKVLCTLAHCMVYICTIFWKCTLCTSFNAWLHSEQLAGRTFCIEDNLHSGRLRSRYLPLWIFVTMGARILRYNCMVPFNILVESLDKRPPGHNTHFLYTDSCP